MNNDTVNNSLCEIEKIKIQKQKEIDHFEQKVFLIDKQIWNLVSKHKKMIETVEHGEKANKDYEN